MKATLLTGRPVLGGLGLQPMGMVLLENTAKTRKNTLEGTLRLSRSSFALDLESGCALDEMRLKWGGVLILASLQC